MSGHSKWSTIKRQKGIADKKRGQTFTKLSNAITIAVKQGGGIGDPSSNFRLRLAIDSARNSNMPKENIERAIQRATANKAENFEEVIYEGFAPGGISVIIEAATDNSMRTTSEIKSLFNKSNASFGQPGSVSYLFQTVGQISVKKNDKSFDEIFLEAADSGAEDAEDAIDEVLIYSEVSDLNRVKESLIQKGLEVTGADISRKPLNKIDITDSSMLEKIGNFLDKIEEMDDVQKVYSNLA